MWTAAGQRVTAEPGFIPEAPPEVRDLYRRHARGNSLFRNRGDGTFEDVTLAARAQMGRWAWSSDALDLDNDGFEDLYVVNGMFTREPSDVGVDQDSFFWRQVVARSPLTDLPCPLSGLRGRPAVLLFWAASAPASRVALAELARQRRALADFRAALLAVAVDPPSDEPKVRAAARASACRSRWPARRRPRRTRSSAAISSTSARTCGCRRSSSSTLAGRS
ncbi:MAG TPA: FG-GAP-like repeat-containing protein [Vicinamibacteria bacterium]